MTLIHFHFYTTVPSTDLSNNVTGERIEETRGRHRVESPSTPGQRLLPAGLGPQQTPREPLGSEFDRTMLGRLGQKAFVG